MEYRSSYEQANTFQSYWQDNPYPNFYNENPRNQPNFSWTSNDVPNPPFQPTYQEPYYSPYQSAYQPPGYQQQQQYTQHQPNNDLAELKAMMQQYMTPQPQHQPNNEVAELKAELKAMMQQNMTAQKNREAQISQLMAHNKMIENQIAQLATSNSTRQPENLPPQGQQPHETVNAIMLQGGTHYKGPEMSIKEGEEEEVENAENEKSAPKADRLSSLTDRPSYDLHCRKPKTDRLSPKADRLFEAPGPIFDKSVENSEILNSEAEAKVQEPEKPIVIQLPFPNRQRQAKVDSQFGKFMEVVRNIPKMSKDDEVEVSGKNFDVEIVDEAGMEHEGPNTNQDARILHEKEDIIDKSKPSSLPREVQSESLTWDPLEALIYLDSCEDQIDNHSAVVDALEAALYGKELTTEQSGKVSELVHTSKAIEVKNLELKPSPPNVYMHKSHLEKGHYSCFKGKHSLKSTMQAVTKKGVVPKKDGPSRGIKRCWDPGGFFDEVETVSGAWRRNFGSSFGGANGRGTQDDYDDPGDA